MAERVEITTAEELEDFLMAKPIEWAQVVAVRIALRILPTANWAFRDERLTNKKK